MAAPRPMSPAQASRKASLPLLKTPVEDKTTVLPSAHPKSPHPTFLKVEEDVRTPITPPTAYTDFLKALSPAVSTPLTSASTMSSFSFSDRQGRLTPMLTPISQPSSTGSSFSYRCEAAASLPKSNSAPPALSATSAPLVPPSPFVRPSLNRTTSARTPTALKKLRIPQSPYSTVGESPRSATTTSTITAGPRTATTPKSAAAMLRSPYSPTSWYIEGRTRCYPEPPKSGRPRAMSVRQVITRTVTYTSKLTPLEPAPRGKRRRVE